MQRVPLLIGCWLIALSTSGFAQNGLIFADGFESGDTTGWSMTVP